MTYRAVPLVIEFHIWIEWSMHAFMCSKNAYFSSMRKLPYHILYNHLLWEHFPFFVDMLSTQSFYAMYRRSFSSEREISPK